MSSAVPGDHADPTWLPRVKRLFAVWDVAVRLYPSDHEVWLGGRPSIGVDYSLVGPIPAKEADETFGRWLADYERSDSGEFPWWTLSWWVRQRDSISIQLVHRLSLRLGKDTSSGERHVAEYIEQASRGYLDLLAIERERVASLMQNDEKAFSAYSLVAEAWAQGDPALRALTALAKDRAADLRRRLQGGDSTTPDVDRKARNVFPKMSLSARAATPPEYGGQPPVLLRRCGIDALSRYATLSCHVRRAHLQ